jgi:hypothetical protein
MREGIHLVNVFVSPVVCRPFKVLAGECRWEYMVKRVRLPFLVHFQRWIGELSSMIVASAAPAANAGGTTWHCGPRFDSGLRPKTAVV